MRAVSLAASVVAGMSTAFAAVAQGDPKRGAEVYRVCVVCHAMEPGLHLSGPSLGNIIGRAAGTAGAADDSRTQFVPLHVPTDWDKLSRNLQSKAQS